MENSALLDQNQKSEEPSFVTKSKEEGQKESKFKILMKEENKCNCETQDKKLFLKTSI